jgi:hypothetical protein
MEGQVVRERGFAGKDLLPTCLLGPLLALLPASSPWRAWSIFGSCFVNVYRGPNGSQDVGEMAGVALDECVCAGDIYHAYLGHVFRTLGGHPQYIGSIVTKY